MNFAEPTHRSGQDVSGPVLETRRLVLRAPRLADGSEIAMLANDRRIAENTLEIRHPYTVADARAFVNRVSFGEGGWDFLIRSRNGAIMGAVGLSMPDQGHAPALRLWIGAPYWGHGYATEAARAVIDYAFDDLECPLVEARARVTSAASRRVLEKCGFQWTGVVLCRLPALGASAPFDRFRLERAIWSSLKNWGPMRRVA